MSALLRSILTVRSSYFRPVIAYPPDFKVGLKQMDLVQYNYHRAA